MSLASFIRDALDGMGGYAKADARHRAYLKARGLRESPFDWRFHRNYERGYRFGAMVAVANLLGLLFSPWTTDPNDWSTPAVVFIFSFVSPRAWAFVGGFFFTSLDDDDGVGPTPSGA